MSRKTWVFVLFAMAAVGFVAENREDAAKLIGWLLIMAMIGATYGKERIE